ncbi:MULTISPECIES: aminotransferase class V-fold PLP-dependent enzyme [unclassified Nostoc]|uniref:aminotransferase class V-fold PLP-dependent enzyme n=1 Tax=unclassified Nostoc TaxID=2593658 RepID=UPI002AD2DF3F|nr:aminotransferase class V-fold PLP-dependent enzyme [Nostoc sp. DedQUE03]MDZ7973371.1 aminotransferase class V-fold PLP-dependent enzyme [Nostoc sp. DedQUE03]MDZ8045354.1 aminotransferase class V-fold PLP-dependent enzyme [Nostoc sp. DedQUE02]
MDILAQQYRRHFPILETACYMISNSLGAMPKEAKAELDVYTKLWEFSGVEAWHQWFPLVNEVSSLFANIIGANSEDVVLIHNLTIANAIIASSLDFSGQRNKVVYTDLHFPSISYVWQGWQKYGARPVVIQSEDGITIDPEKICAAIDETTLIVPISHVYFRSGALQDVRSIIDRAHQMGALVILDSYQAAGVVPIDVKALDIDILMSGVLKWLCGGPGAAFMYVRQNLQEQFQPAIRGWLADREPFAFNMPDVNFTLGMHRFLTSSIQVPCLYTARSGLKIITEVGVEAIRKKSLELTDRIIALADEFGFTVNTPRDPVKRGGAITVNYINGSTEDSSRITQKICEHLIARRFIVDYRPPLGIRIAPHFYNTLDEVEAVMLEMRLLKEKLMYHDD